MPRNGQWRLAARPGGTLQALRDFLWSSRRRSPSRMARCWCGRSTSLSIPRTAGGPRVNVPARRAPRRGHARLRRRRVVESRASGLAAGDAVSGLLGWQRYAVVKAPRSHGCPTWTPDSSRTSPSSATSGSRRGWVCSRSVGRRRARRWSPPAAGRRGVPSSVRSAKLRGCYVIGSTGSDEKCRWLTDELGVDAAINYKAEPIRAALKEKAPNGIDVYFDNVGGDHLDAALPRMKPLGRIPVRDDLGVHGKGPPPGPPNLGRLLVQRAGWKASSSSTTPTRQRGPRADLVGLAPGRPHPLPPRRCRRAGERAAGRQPAVRWHEHGQAGGQGRRRVSRLARSPAPDRGARVAPGRAWALGRMRAPVRATIGQSPDAGDVQFPARRTGRLSSTTRSSRTTPRRARSPRWCSRSETCRTGALSPHVAVVVQDLATAAALRSRRPLVKERDSPSGGAPILPTRDERGEGGEEPGPDRRRFAVDRPPLGQGAPALRRARPAAARARRRGSPATATTRRRRPRTPSDPPAARARGAAR